MSVVARASSTDASRLRFGSFRFVSVRFVSVRSFVRGTSSRSFATKSAGGVWDVVVCDSPLRTRAYGMVGVGRSSCLNAMEKEKVHIGGSNGYRRVASRARAVMC